MPRRASSAGTRPALLFQRSPLDARGMRTVTATHASRHLWGLLDAVAKGERFTITRAGRVVAELRPVAAALPPGRCDARWSGYRHWTATSKRTSSRQLDS